MKKTISIIAIIALSSSLFASNIDNKIEKESLSHNTRIQILQKADSCIKHAKNIEEYKKCENFEKQSRRDFRNKMKNMSFSEMKTKILSKINNRLGKLEKSKSCVENAQSKKELKSCRPKRNKFREMGRGMNREMGRGMGRGMGRE